ncbi:bifunctional phosphoglucose/phosphomannose isomerase [Bacteroidota bacterium]
MVQISMDDVLSIDTQNMYDILKAFPGQVKDAVIIGENSNGFSNSLTSKKFAVLGMGGSAIGGDILASYLSNTNGTKDFIINTIRNYTLPGFIDRDTNIIGSSYSGGTEETITAFSEAMERCDNLICITTGGKLGEIAENKSIPIIKIPSGYQPRCALGYSFFPMLFAILKTNLMDSPTISTIRNEINETIDILRKRANEYSALDDHNQALNLAKKIFGTVPVIYSSVDCMDSVSTRWIRQIQENAKHLAFGGLLPEMNHNEINSFSYPSDISQRLSLIFVRDIVDHPRTQKRFDALTKLIAENVKQVITVRSDANSLLGRMFDMIYLGDWVSYYLAILNRTDPTPIPLITKLKNILLDT